MKIFFKKKEKLLPPVICLFFYFLLPSFGINEEIYKNIFVLLAALYLFFLFFNRLSFLFYILNLLFSIFLYQNNLYSFTTVFLQIFFVAIFPLKLDTFITYKQFEIFNSKSTYSYISVIFIFLSTIFTQNNYLGFEIIDHDVSTFLIMAREFFDGFLPYERQWEAHPPLLHFLNYLILIPSNLDFVKYKIFFDVFTFLNAVTIYFIIVNRYKKSFTTGFLGSFSFLLFMSQPWATVEYSETVSLTFLSSAYYIILSSDANKTFYFMSGLLFATATLINTGTLLFVLGFLYVIFNFKFQTPKKLLYFFLGFLFIHLVTYGVYFINGLVDIYLLTLIDVPLAYTSTDSFFFYDIRVFLESIYKTNTVLGILFFLLTFQNLRKIIDFKLLKANKSFVASNLFFLFLSVLFIYLAGKGYYHHYIYLIFFVSLSIFTVDTNFLRYSTYILLFLLSATYTQTIVKNSYINLSDLDRVYNSYPIHKISKDLQQQLDIYDFQILALDNTLLAFYLQKPTGTLITHPTNHSDQYIVDLLHGIGLIEENYIDLIVASQPDVIVCSTDIEFNNFYSLTVENKFKCNDLSSYNYDNIYNFNNKYEKGQFYYNSAKKENVYVISRK
jgi:hypothetical protein